MAVRYVLRVGTRFIGRSGPIGSIQIRAGIKAATQNITMAFTALGAGDTTRALDALERAAREREALGFMAPFALPAYDSIRGRARFAAVARAFGADPAVFARPAGGAR